MAWIALLVLMLLVAAAPAVSMAIEARRNHHRYAEPVDPTSEQPRAIS